MISRNVGESRVEIGDFTYGDNELKIRQWGEGASLTIGKYCSIGDGIEIFLGGDHRVDWITTYPFGHTNQAVFNNFAGVGHPQSKGNVVIGNDVWLGSSCKIMSGVSIGDGAVIGGSAVVVKDVAPYSIVGGNPAKLLKYRFDNNTITLLLKLRW